MITQVFDTPRRLGRIPSFSSDFIDSEIFTADFIMSALAQKAVMKVLKGHMEQYAPADPHYEEVIDERTGKKTKVKRKVPDGLSKRDAKVLKKVRKRAHRLDKGMNLCGFRVGYTFFIGIVPGLGDAVNAGLNYFLVVKPSRSLDIPKDLVAKMIANNTVSFGLGLIPIIGDVGLAAWKANSRNAHLLEAYLTIRGQEYLASLGQAQSALDSVANPAEVREAFAPGSGMDGAPATKGLRKRGAN
ncbi:hypothetical protein DB88DRAFT_494271 [Papiliotrema laurentii]|uniref:Uncharacterized protein n=1 Tax=Papiliotrema laurentii TaxID=5418 RepID=A0AAD9FL04_PAPLA|nr:hypothetical protein DB88DRAFT_494271 [Papiliotrema laurentii]